MIPANHNEACHFIDFAAITQHIGAYSGGEQRFLRLAASLGGGEEVQLSEVVWGLDRELVDLVLAGIARAAGTHEGSVASYDDQEGSPDTQIPAPSTRGRGSHERRALS